MGAAIGAGVRRHSRMGPPVKPEDGGMGMDGRDGMGGGGGVREKKRAAGFPGRPFFSFPAGRSGIAASRRPG